MPLFTKEDDPSITSGVAAPKTRPLIESSFRRLSSEFRVSEFDPTGDAMDLSEAFVERIRQFTRSPRDGPHSGARAHDENRNKKGEITTIIVRMRELAAEVASLDHGLYGFPPGDQEFAELRDAVQGFAGRVYSHATGPPRSSGRSGGDVGPRGTVGSAATGTLIQRLVSAIAHAQALRGNLAAASTTLEEITLAEEMMMLARAEALLEDGVARLSAGASRSRSPPPTANKQLLN
ncbi:MAG: hypothetical protein EXR75_02105 [Myxococcales bacterium]|nr:hypothetical protein [Myxococcales bacterium]